MEPATIPVQAAYPVKVEIPQQEKYSRGLALATLLLFIPKAIILVPHFIMLYVLGLVAFICMVLAQVVVLFTAKYPKSMFDFVAGTTRWQTRVNAYFLGLTDSYPPFQLRQ